MHLGHFTRRGAYASWRAEGSWRPPQLAAIHGHKRRAWLARFGCGRPGSSRASQAILDPAWQPSILPPPEMRHRRQPSNQEGQEGSAASHRGAPRVLQDLTPLDCRAIARFAQSYLSEPCHHSCTDVPILEGIQPFRHGSAWFDPKTTRRCSSADWA
jgi:hypothetical protein